MTDDRHKDRTPIAGAIFVLITALTLLGIHLIVNWREAQWRAEVDRRIREYQERYE